MDMERRRDNGSNEGRHVANEGKTKVIPRVKQNVFPLFLFKYLM